MNWVMLRGLGRHSDHWGNFATMMQDEFEHILKLDFPGMDNEAHAPISISEITDFLREKFLAKKSEGPWSIMAISLGGMVALDWVARYPQDFKHLITINSSSRMHSKFYERLKPMAIKTILQLAFEKNLRDRERKVLEITTNEIIISNDVLNEAEKTAKKMKLNKKIFAKQLFAATKFKLPQKLSTPYTTIVCEKDRFVDASCSKKIANFYQSELLTHPRAGHDLPNDDPNWLLNIIKEKSSLYHV